MQVRDEHGVDRSGRENRSRASAPQMRNTHPEHGVGEEPHPTDRQVDRRVTDPRDVDRLSHDRSLRGDDDFADDYFELPKDWRSMHHKKLIALARKLGGEDEALATRDGAIAFIEERVALEGNTLHLEHP